MSKELTYQTGKITTNPVPGSWSTAFEFAPPSASDKASRGVMLAVAAISASEKFDAPLAGQQVLSVLQESYYTQVTGGILPALERAVTAAHERLITLVFSGESQEDSVDFSLAVGVLWGSVFYLAQLGEARAVIHRGGELKLIGHRSGTEDSDLSVEGKPDVRVASGLLEVGDKIILGTPRFFDLIPTAELSAVVGTGSASLFTEKLEGRVSGEPMAAAQVMTLGIESTPTPAEDSLNLVEPGLAEELKTPAPAETVNPPVMVEPGVIEGAKTPAEEDLSIQVANDLGRYSSLAKGTLSKGAELTKKTIHHTRRIVHSSGLLPALTTLSRKAWEKLGSPRTALEGVAEARTRRTLLLLAGVLLLILLGSSIITSLTRGDGEKKLKFDQLMAAAQAQYEEASISSSLNRLHAKDLLSSASDNLRQADELDVDDKKVGDLRGQVEGLLETVNQVYRVTPALTYDLSTLRASAQGVDMVGDDKNLYVLDPGGALYSVPIGATLGEVLSTDLALSEGKSLAKVGDSLLVHVPEQGIFGYDLKTKKFGQTTKVDNSWGRLVDFAAYSGNLYVLDAAEGEIWRYTPVSSAQLGPSTQWIKENSNFQEATGLAVDGSVWVAQRDDLWKYTRGAKESFIVQDVTPAFSDVKAIYTDAEDKNIYLLEPGRLVVVSKLGIYQAQYVSDTLNSMTSLWVDEAADKAYVLSGTSVYTIDLRSN